MVHGAEGPKSLFGEDVSIRGSGGKFNSNSNLRLGVEGNESLTFKYRPASQTLTVSFKRQPGPALLPHTHYLHSCTFPPFFFFLSPPIRSLASSTRTTRV